MESWYNPKLFRQVNEIFCGLRQLWNDGHRDVMLNLATECGIDILSFMPVTVKSSTMGTAKKISTSMKMKQKSNSSTGTKTIQKQKSNKIFNSTKKKRKSTSTSTTKMKRKSTKRNHHAAIKNEIQSL